MSLAAAEPKAGRLDLQGEAYYADTDFVSHSMLDVFRRSVPEYHGRFIAGTLAAPKPTPAMRLGNLVDAALLEPDLWRRRLHVPKLDRRTARGKAEAQHLEEWLAAHPGGLWVDDEEDAWVMQMADAALRHPVARAALTDPGENQQPLCLRQAGLWCKGKPDRVLDSGLIVDLKTAADSAPEAFARACVSYGYGRQSPYYLDGAAEAVGAEGPFLFVVIGKEPPHEVACVVLDSAAIELGRQQNNRALEELARCVETDCWASRWERIQAIGLPRYAFTEV